MLTLAVTYPVHNYSFLLHFLDFFLRHVQISHLRPNWKTINFELLLKNSHKTHLVPGVVKDSLLQLQSFFLIQVPMINGLKSENISQRGTLFAFRRKEN